MPDKTDLEILPELRGKTVEDFPSAGYPDELRGKTPDELAQFVDVLDAHLRSIHATDDGELRDKTPDEQKAFAYGLKLREAAFTRIEEDRAIREVFRRRPKAVQQAIDMVGYKSDDPFREVRRMAVPEARDGALRVLDDRTASAHLRSDQKDEVERQIRKSTDIARRILVTENDAYRTAWQKLVTDPNAAMLLTDDERHAMQAYAEYRALSEGSTTGGGFGIPVFIDPSIILTAQGTDNPFLELCKQVDVNTNAWKGVSSAGVTWHFNYAEGSAVSDDSPVFAQPTVNVNMARGFLPYSIELGQDYPGFADEMATLLSSGYNELLVDKFTRGAGQSSLEPNGILTALSANTNVRVALTTGGTVGAPDPYKVWQALPQRFRNKASWLMSVATNNAIRQLGTANVYHAYTVNLPQDWADTLFRRQVRESPYMPDNTTNTTATIGIAVVGDFSNYVIARRGGMSVELVPMLFDVTNNRPTGQRGWFAYSRIGGGSANDLGFRLLTNT
ncbi:MAG TPA: phage major capsid protein [Streptosporangiaceae bacterium]|nr:phage major capsid protein [Streptosporangiaceae bacterium]